MGNAKKQFLSDKKEMYRKTDERMNNRTEEQMKSTGNRQPACRQAGKQLAKCME
jgi:hypothetical protein